MTSPASPPPFDLREHVGIVTGANHGIGAATARALAGCGASVLIAYLRLNDSEDNPEQSRINHARDAEHVVADIVRAGGRATAIEADLRDSTSPGRLFDAAEEAFGPVDILVNNASGCLHDTFGLDEPHVSGAARGSVSADSIDSVFSVDARGGALMIAEFSRRHLERKAKWGRIVGLTSSGRDGFPGEVSYGAAKAALESYTMSAAYELAPHGVTANLVHPPVTDTGWVTDAVREMVENSPGLMRISQPEEVAQVVAYLCSDEARLITANIVHLR